MFDCLLNLSSGVLVLSGIILFLFIFDVPYFLRAIFVLGYGKLFEPKLHPEHFSRIYGMCTTSDLDIIFKHMNNARYLRELDFARFHYYERSGLYDLITKNKGVVLQSACTIKYRRTIPLFNLYKIDTKLIYWDEKAFYLEQQFVTLGDEFIRAIAYSKQGVVGVNVNEIMAKALNKDLSYKPEPIPELQYFMDCLDASSKRLRKSD